MMVNALPLFERPKTRADCIDGPRPCPWVSCRSHLLLDVAEDGRLLKSREFDEDDEDSIAAALYDMAETCAKDVASRGGLHAPEVAVILGLGLRSIVAIQQGAAEKVRVSGVEFDEREHPEDFYIRYSNAGADELAWIASDLRSRTKGDK